VKLKVRILRVRKKRNPFTFTPFIIEYEAGGKKYEVSAMDIEVEDEMFLWLAVMADLRKRFMRKACTREKLLKEFEGLEAEVEV